MTPSDHRSSSEGEAAGQLAPFGISITCWKAAPELYLQPRRSGRIRFPDDGGAGRRRHRQLPGFVHRRFGESPEPSARWTASIPSWAQPRRADGFSDHALSALRDLVPVLALAVKAADARRGSPAPPAGSISVAMPSLSRRCAGALPRRHRAHSPAVLWFSDLRGSTALSENAGRPARSFRFLNDYAQAAIQAIHDAGGDVLKLIGDGVLRRSSPAMAWRRLRRPPRCGRAPVAEQHGDHSTPRRGGCRPAGSRRPHVGLHVGAGVLRQHRQRDRLDFARWSGPRSTRSAASRRCAARSDQASCWPRRTFAVRLDASRARKLSGLHRPLCLARHRLVAGSVPSIPTSSRMQLHVRPLRPLCFQLTAKFSCASPPAQPARAEIASPANDRVYPATYYIRAFCCPRT